MDSDTFSQESADGLKPCGSLAGHQAEACGLAPAPVSPTRRRGSRRATKTNGICGQPSPASSESVALTQFLASKCQELLGTGGSIEYTQTWKEKATPSGIVYYQLVALVRPTSEDGFTGWATPAARDYRSESATPEFNAKRDAHPRGKPLSYQVLGAVIEQPDAETESGDGCQLNPSFSRWLMGFPPEWCDCAGTETQ